eukprot:GHVU01006426.1.p1 GENE.GHVU01006426.1~~GHVU01006426.1.p1  ORF type:complete len:182 (-),score=24.51 GHVU01006426.1:132-677(-)
MPPIRDRTEDAELERRRREREQEQKEQEDDEAHFEDASEEARRRSQELGFAALAFGAPRIGGWDEQQVPTMLPASSSANIGTPAYVPTNTKQEQEGTNDEGTNHQGRPSYPNNQQEQRFEEVHEEEALPDKSIPPGVDGRPVNRSVSSSTLTTPWRWASASLALRRSASSLSSSARSSCSL